jgi:hypothetical protein
LPEAGDGAIDAAAGAVGEAGVQEFLLVAEAELAGDGSLEDAVANGGNEEGAGGFAAGFLFEENAEEGKGPVGAVAGFGEEGLEMVVETLGELLERDAVDAGTALVFTDALPGGVEVREGEGRAAGHGL